MDPAEERAQLEQRLAEKRERWAQLERAARANPHMHMFQGGRVAGFGPLRNEIDQLERDLEAMDRAEAVAAENAQAADAALTEIEAFDPSGFEFNVTDDLLFGDSPEVSQAQADPNSVLAQRRALAQLSEWSDPAVTGAERAAYDAENMQSRLQADQMARGQRDALAQQYAARGIGGSMSELAQQMSANQAQAQRYALGDTQNRANMLQGAQARALNALSSYGNQANNMNNQSFNQDLQRRSAADRWRESDLELRRQAAVTNNDRGFQAARENQGLQNRAVQDQYDNRRDHAESVSDVYAGNAAYADQRRREEELRSANRTAGFIETGVGTGGALEAGFSNKPRKKDKGGY